MGRASSFHNFLFISFYLQNIVLSSADRLRFRFQITFIPGCICMPKGREDCSILTKKLLKKKSNRNQCKNNLNLKIWKILLINIFYVSKQAILDIKQRRLFKISQERRCIVNTKID